MRKERFLVGALVLAAGVAVSGSAYAATAVVTIDAVVGGKEKPKLDKKTFKGTSIEVSTTTVDAADPIGLLPPKPSQAVINYDPKDIKFNHKAAPGCDPSQLAATTTEDAIAACGEAQVGEGASVANLPFGPGGTRQDVPAVVTAFNRSDTNGLLLHARASSLQTTTLLLGELSRGSKLTITVPPIAGGAGSSSEFSTKVRFKDYVQARCKDKKIDYDVTFTFSDGTAPASASDQQPCKQKKKQS